jgi:hypothetical protein
LDFSDDE